MTLWEGCDFLAAGLGSLVVLGCRAGEANHMIRREGTENVPGGKAVALLPVGISEGTEPDEQCLPLWLCVYE